MAEGLENIGANLFARGVLGSGNGGSGGGGGGEGGFGAPNGGPLFWWCPLPSAVNSFNMQQGAIRTNSNIVAAVSFGKPGSWGDKLLKAWCSIADEFVKGAKEVGAVYSGQITNGAPTSGLNGGGFAANISAPSNDGPSPV